MTLLATRCEESPIVKETVYFIFSLPSQQEAGNALAVQFMSRRRRIYSFLIAPLDPAYETGFA
jgi:hypothetical protein